MKPERGKKGTASTFRASLRKTFKRAGKRGSKRGIANRDLVDVRDLADASAADVTPLRKGNASRSFLFQTPLGTSVQKWRRNRAPLDLPDISSKSETEVIVVDASVQDDLNDSGASSSSSLTIESVENDSLYLSSVPSAFDGDDDESLSPDDMSSYLEDDSDDDDLKDNEGTDCTDGGERPLEAPTEMPQVKYSEEYRLVPLDSQPAYLLLLPKANTRLPVRGRASISSIFGKVLILGYDITPDLKVPVDVFCPTNVSFLCLQTSEGKGRKLSKDEKRLLKTKLSSYQLRPDTIDEIMSEMTPDSTLLYISSLRHEPSKFLTTFHKHLYTGGSAKRTITKDEATVCQKVGLFLNPSGTQVQNSIHLDSDYEDVAQNILESVQCGSKTPCILFVGAKNSGKSTALRYMVNRLQNICSNACYLECDPGQTEFTAPAVLSLHLITNPLLGPPFTHPHEPELAFFLGDVSPANHAENYVKIVAALYQHYLENFPSLPLFINTMGWVEGLGLGLLREIVGKVRPTHAVQLVPEGEVPVSLVPPDSDECELSYFNISSDGNSLAYKPEQTLQITSRCQSDSYQASFHRELGMLSALSHLLVLNPAAESLLAIRPHVVPWSSVILHVCHEQVPMSQLLYVANANIVALCHTSNEEMERCRVIECDEGLKTFSQNPASQFLGIGIVRGIDPKQKLFYILPAVRREILPKVNTLLVSSLSIPDCILRQQSCLEDAPYMSETFDGNICGSQPVKPKTYLKRGAGEKCEKT